MPALVDRGPVPDPRDHPAGRHKSPRRQLPEVQAWPWPRVVPSDPGNRRRVRGSRRAPRRMRRLVQPLQPRHSSDTSQRQRSSGERRSEGHHREAPAAPRPPRHQGHGLHGDKRPETHLMGRQGGYTSKTAWVDPGAVKAGDAGSPSSDPGGIEWGGGIEVFPTVAGARAHLGGAAGLQDPRSVTGTTTSGARRSCGCRTTSPHPRPTVTTRRSGRQPVHTSPRGRRPSWRHRARTDGGTSRSAFRRGGTRAPAGSTFPQRPGPAWWAAYQLEAEHGG